MRLPAISLATLCRGMFFSAITVITLLALCPADTVVVTTGWDKANHLLAFSVLLWLLDFSWPAPAFMLRKVTALLAYGLLIEYLQTITATRVFSLLDWLADALGLALYLVARSRLLPLRAMLLRLPFVETESMAAEKPPCRDC